MNGERIERACRLTELEELGVWVYIKRGSRSLLHAIDSLLTTDSRAENLLQLLSKLSIPSTPPTVFNEQSPTQFHPT